MKGFLTESAVVVYSTYLLVNYLYEYVTLSGYCKFENVCFSDWERNVELAQLIQQKLDAYKVKEII